MRAMHTMHTTSTLLRVELSAHAATLRTFAIVVAVFAAANLVMHGATPTIVVCILTVAFLPSILFAQDERAHLDIMYAVLPVSRTRLVVGRYLFIAISAVFMTLAGVAAAQIDELVHGPEPSSVPLSMAAVAGMALAVVGAVAAVQLPFFFALGHARTGMYAYGTTMLLMLGGMVLIDRVPDLSLAIVRWASLPWSGPVGVGIAAVLLIISAACSVRLYRGRSL
jgi:membrane protein